MLTTRARADAIGHRFDLVDLVDQESQESLGSFMGNDLANAVLKRLNKNDWQSTGEDYGAYFSALSAEDCVVVGPSEAKIWARRELFLSPTDSGRSTA